MFIAMQYHCVAVTESTEASIAIDDRRTPTSFGTAVGVLLTEGLSRPINLRDNFGMAM
jgi:hypothetical protein